MLELGQRLRAVAHAEVHGAVVAAAQVGHQRVVGVQHEAHRRPGAAASAATSSAQRSASVSSSP